MDAKQLLQRMKAAKAGVPDALPAPTPARPPADPPASSSTTSRTDNVVDLMKRLRAAPAPAPVDPQPTVGDLGSEELRRVLQAEASLPAPDTITYVTTQDVLSEALAAWAQVPAIGLDVETTIGASRKLCLVQVSTGDHTWVVDPFAVDVQVMWPLFEAPAPVKIIHNAPFERSTLRTQFGATIEGVFDTQVHARSLGYDQLALMFVAQRALGVIMDKSEQRSEWDRRPLTPKQVAYAARDAAILVKLWEKWDRPPAHETPEKWKAPKRVDEARAMEEAFVRHLSQVEAERTRLQAEVAQLAADREALLQNMGPKSDDIDAVLRLQAEVAQLSAERDRLRDEGAAMLLEAAAELEQLVTQVTAAEAQVTAAEARAAAAEARATALEHEVVAASRPEDLETIGRLQAEIDCLRTSASTPPAEEDDTDAAIWRKRLQTSLQVMTAVASENERLKQTIERLRQHFGEPEASAVLAADPPFVLPETLTEVLEANANRS